MVATMFALLFTTMVNVLGRKIYNTIGTRVFVLVEGDSLVRLFLLLVDKLQIRKLQNFPKG